MKVTNSATTLGINWEYYSKPKQEGKAKRITWKFILSGKKSITDLAREAKQIWQILRKSKRKENLERKAGNQQIYKLKKNNQRKIKQRENTTAIIKSKGNKNLNQSLRLA